MPSSISQVRARHSAAGKSGSAQDRLNNFDFLRLFLAVVVIFSHGYSLGTGSEANEPFSLLTRGQTNAGIIAMSFFFIMSGYLITASFFHSKGPLDYLGKRVRRIYPGFVASMLFGALCVVPLSGGVLDGGDLLGKILNFGRETLQLTEFQFIGCFTQIPYPNAVNGSVWSIFYEFGCYIGVLVLGVAGLLSQRGFVLGTFLASVVMSIEFSVFGLQYPALSPLGFHLGIASLWARLVPLYLAGVVAWLYRDRIRYTRIGAVACLAALLVACLVPLAWNAVFPFAGTYLLFWVAFHPSIRLYHAAKFGDFSYGTYLSMPFLSNS
jgi:peptidoglycan/LPS O-acetylase OafA/YrhL